MGITFDMTGDELVVRRPDGGCFLTYLELSQRAAHEAQRAERAEQEVVTLRAILKGAGIPFEKDQS